MEGKLSITERLIEQARGNLTYTRLNTLETYAEQDEIKSKLHEKLMQVLMGIDKSDNLLGDSLQLPSVLFILILIQF